MIKDCVCIFFYDTTRPVSLNVRHAAERDFFEEFGNEDGPLPTISKVYVGKFFQYEVFEQATLCLHVAVSS